MAYNPRRIPRHRNGQCRRPGPPSQSHPSHPPPSPLPPTTTSPTDQACSNPGTNAAFQVGPTKGMCSTRAAWVVPKPNLHRSLSPPPSCTPTFRAPNTTLSSAGSQANAPRPAPVPAGTTQGQTPPPAAARLRLIVSIEKDKANPTREVASQSAQLRLFERYAGRVCDL